MLKKKKIYPASASKHNSDCEKQAILLMIPNREKHEQSKTLATRAKSEKRWHYLSVKKWSALLRGITFKHYDDFCCINYSHSFKTKNKLEHIKNYVK